MKTLTKAKKFTFKTTKPTGRYKSFSNPYHEILLEGEVIGLIDYETNKLILKVKKQVLEEDGNPNCTWKWIKLSKTSNSLQEAKDFANEVFKLILEKYELAIKD